MCASFLCAFFSYCFINVIVLLNCDFFYNSNSYFLDGLGLIDYSLFSYSTYFIKDSLKITAQVFMDQICFLTAFQQCQIIVVRRLTVFCWCKVDVLLCTLCRTQHSNFNSEGFWKIEGEWQVVEAGRELPFLLAEHDKMRHKVNITDYGFSK